MISVQQNAECLTKLGMLKFFPVKESVVAEIGRLLNELCENDHEARRLTGIAVARWSEWPGPNKIKELYASEIASRRPREVGPEGCGRCSGGLRPVFQVFEQLADGSEGKQIIYPEGNILRAEQELFKRFANSKTHRVYTGVLVPCSCPLGVRERDKLQQVESQGYGK